MKNRIMKLMLLLMIAALILPACSKQASSSQGGFAVVTDTTTPDNNAIPNNNDPTTDVSNDPTPITFEHTLEVGKLRYTLDNVQVVTNINDAGAGGFDPFCAVALHNGAYYQQAQENWKEYGDLYETVYTYPQFITDGGELIDGAHMILLDMTVTSQDATNEYKKPNGEWEARYGNPYLFKLNTILFLVDRSQLDIGASGMQTAFFSEYGKHQEHPMAIELKPDESITVRIGFLVGDRADGTPTQLSDLVISTNASSLDNIWFDLNLEDAA